MGFSRQQKLHFKLAMQNFARQARAAAAQGLSVLQETPSYAFLMACQDIAMRQLSSGETSPQATSEAAAAAAAAGQQSTGDAAAAPAGEGSSRAGPSSAGVLAPACDPAGTASAGTASAGAAAGARGRAGAGGPAGGVEAASGPGFAGQQQQQSSQPRPAEAAAGGVSTRRQQQQVRQPPPAEASAAGGVSTGGQQQQFSQQEEQAMVDVDAPSSPTRKLQHQLGIYYRQVVNLNIFLADTLTLQQALMLNIASYPFWPNLSAVAEAAIQLPDDPEDPALQAGQQGGQQGQEGIELLMRKRRSFMQQAHFEWWRDYGRPGAGPPPE